MILGRIYLCMLRWEMEKDLKKWIRLLEIMAFYAIAHKISVTVGNNLDFAISGSGNYYDGARQCSRYGANWTLPNEQTPMKEFKNFIEKEGIPSAWLLPQRIVFEHWQWINGSKYVGPDLRETYEMLCAALSIPSNKIRAVKCGTSGYGLLCSMPENAACPMEKQPYTCSNHGTLWYFIGCSAKNFYEARQYCEIKGGDLAVFEDNGALESILTFIKVNQFSDKCSTSSFYVGVQKETWIVPSPRRDINPGSFWGPKEPQAINGNCSVITESGWKTRHCSEKTDIVCHYYGILGDSLAVSTKNQTFDDKVSKTIPVVLGILLALSSIPSLVMVLLYAGRRWLRPRGKMCCRRKKRSEDCQENGMPERKKLLKGEEEKATDEKEDNLGASEKIVPIIDLPFLKKKIPSFHGIIVVIFSSKIRESPQLQDVPIWPLSTGEVGKYEKDGTDIAIKLVDGFISVFQDLHVNFKTEQSLAILNISGADHQGKLEKGTPTNLIRLIEKETDLHQAYVLIMLPDGHFPIPYETSQLLVDVASYFVCINAATHKVYEMPGFLTIGDVEKPNDTSKTGIVDFLTSSKDATAMEESVARAIGMIAALYYQMKKKRLHFCGPGQNQKTAAMRKLLISIIRKEGEEGFSDDEEPLYLNERVISAIVKMDYTRLKQEVEGACEIRPCLWNECPYNINWDSKDISERKDSLLQRIHEKIENMQSNIKVVFVGQHPNSMGESSVHYGPFGAILKHENNNSIDLTKRISIQNENTFTCLNQAKWRDYEACLDKLAHDKNPPDVLIVLSTKTMPPNTAVACDSLRKLKKSSIVLTNAISMKGQAAPTAFPAETVIAIKGSYSQRDHGACSPTIDLTVNTSNDPHSMKAVTTVAEVAVLILFQVSIGLIELAEDEQKKLRKTAVMRNVLIELCGHPSKHNIEDGYGNFQPWPTLLDTSRLKQILNMYTGKDAPPNNWTGKTLEVE